jgi:hypothetical protein
MMFWKVCVAVTVYLVVAQGASYPSTYPFDKSFEVPELPDETPSFTYDETDSGGYTLKGFQDIDISDCQPNPWGPHCHFGWDHIAFKRWGVCFTEKGTTAQVASMLDVTFWNCTSRAAGVYTAKEFAGTENMEGHTVVCDGECCESHMDNLKFNDDLDAKQSAMGLLYTTSGCPDTPEPVYCGVGDSDASLCSEYWIAPQTRTIVKSCPDVVYTYYTQCTLFAAAGMADDEELLDSEPEAYLKKTSVSGTLWIKALLNLHDRVCFPLSYYGLGPDDDSSSTAISKVLAILVVSAASLMNV